MKTLLFAVIPVACVIGGCTQQTPPLRTYGYVFHETTGITHHILHNGKEVAITFRNDSEPVALKSLQTLKADVLYAKADGKQIVVVGRLHSTVHRTPRAPDRAQSEPYQEFTMQEWHIEAP